MPMRKMPKFRKGERVVWRLKKRMRGGVMPSKTVHGVVHSQTKSGNRSSVWVLFDEPVAPGIRLFMTPVADLEHEKQAPRKHR